MFEELKLFENPERNYLLIKNFMDKKKDLINFYKMGQNNEKYGKLVIHDQKINSKQEILKMKNKIIFNCMGYSSRYIFDDESVYPQKGNMICYQNTTKVSNFYSILMGDGERVHVYPGEKRVGVGISRVDKELDEEEDKNTRFILRKNALSFFKPKL